MSQFLNPVQQALFTRLSGNVVASVNGSPAVIPVYDDVPDLPAKMPSVNFPYIVIGEDYGVPWDTDSVIGNEVVITLHTWSRADGKKELKSIMGAIDLLLHRQPATLSAAGYNFVDCFFEFAQVLDQNDGKTRQGICRYRITLEKE